MRELRTLLAAAAVVLAALVTYWSLAGQSQRAGLATALPEGAFDYTLRRFTLTQAGERGHTRYRLQGRRMVHYPGGAESRVRAPRLRLFDDGSESWLITAERGRIDERRRVVDLAGDVEMHRRRRGSQSALTIRTAAATVHPDDERMTSSRRVTLQRPGATIRGTGLEASLNGRRVELRSKVTGTYEPTESK